MKDSIHFYIFTFMLTVFIGIVPAGCDQLSDVNGSFQESGESPRIQVKLDDHTYRFFRFHLRQFDDAISGTFETFDMNSFDLFSQVPILMNNPLNLYYCARIDYGYLRNNTVHIVFTDKEQRQWIFNAKLGQSTLSGIISRTSSRNSSLDIIGQDPEYMLPEDAAYMRENRSDSSHLILESMRDSDASLNCIYYYKSHPLHFVLPDSFPLSNCQPSVKQCHNYRLAIVGMTPVRKLAGASPMLITEVISAFLDDCDLLDGYRRSINLRDNPNTQSGIQSDLFIATAIIYEDVNFDAAWNSESEPILAALDSQSLLFYPSIPDAPIYGESPDGTTYQAPVLSASQIDQTTGWHVYNDESDHTETVPYLRILKHLTPVNSNMLTLSPVHLDVSEGFMPGCYLNPQTPQQMPCTGILPLLVR